MCINFYMCTLLLSKLALLNIPSFHSHSLHGSPPNSPPFLWCTLLFPFFFGFHPFSLALVCFTMTTIFFLIFCSFSNTLCVCTVELWHYVSQVSLNVNKWCSLKSSTSLRLFWGIFSSIIVCPWPILPGCRESCFRFWLYPTLTKTFQLPLLFLEDYSIIRSPSRNCDCDTTEKSQLKFT